MRALLLTSCAALMALSASANALPVVQNAKAGAEHHSAATVASDTADYIRNTAISDMFAVAAAKVAQEKSRNDDVQQFARMILNDRAAMRDTLSAAIRPMTLPADVDGEHAALVKQLDGAESVVFDTNYLEQQILANETTLRVEASYAAHGRDQVLRQYASEALPRLRLELTLAERILQKISPKTASSR